MQQFMHFTFHLDIIIDGISDKLHKSGVIKHVVDICATLQYTVMTYYK